MDDSPIAIDLTTCKSCGICVGVCPRDVFDTDERGNPVVARPNDCTACLLCEWHCPDFAVEVRRRKPVKKARRAAKGTGEAGRVAAERVAAALAAAHSVHHGDDRSHDRDCGED